MQDLELAKGKQVDHSVWSNVCARIQVHLQEVPDDQCAVLVSHCLMGSSFADLAHSCHLSEDSVEGMYKAGIERLYNSIVSDDTIPLRLRQSMNVDFLVEHLANC